MQWEWKPTALVPWRPGKASSTSGNRPTHSITTVIVACGKGGHVSLPGVYGGLDKVPMGAAMNKG